MAEITKALYDRLAGDATLQGLLSSYDGNAAVFTSQPVPDDAVEPYVTIGGLAEAPFDTKTTLGRDLSYDIGCFTKDTGSAVLVEQIKEQVRTLLHRHVLAITDFSTVVADVTGTVQADEDGVYGRIVTIRLIVEED